MSVTHNPTSEVLNRQREITQHIATYLAAGNKIQQIAVGVSGYTHDPKKFSVAKSKKRIAKLEGKA